MPEEVYIVTRVITTAHGTSVAIPMGVFDSKDASEVFMKTMGDEVRRVSTFKALDPEGNVVLDIDIGSFLGGLGIHKISHQAQGPVEISSDTLLIRPPKDNLVVLK
jgi:hypothetical protein